MDAGSHPGRGTADWAAHTILLLGSIVPTGEAPCRPAVVETTEHDLARRPWFEPRPAGANMCCCATRDRPMAASPGLAPAEEGRRAGWGPAWGAGKVTLRRGACRGCGAAAGAIVQLSDRLKSAWEPCQGPEYASHSVGTGSCSQQCLPALAGACWACRACAACEQVAALQACLQCPRRCMLVRCQERAGCLVT